MKGQFLLLVIILSSLKCINSTEIDCKQPAVNLDEEFISCCDGKPSFASIECIDTLAERKMLTEECLVDCLYKETKIYDGKSIDLKAAELFFNTNVTDVHFRRMFMDAFEYCVQIDKVKLKQTFAFAELVENGPCDAFPAYMDQCIWYHSLANCPEFYANANDKCVKNVHWVKQCILH